MYRAPIRNNGTDNLIPAPVFPRIDTPPTLPSIHTREFESENETVISSRISPVLSIIRLFRINGIRVKVGDNYFEIISLDDGRLAFVDHDTNQIIV